MIRLAVGAAFAATISLLPLAAYANAADFTPPPSPSGTDISSQVDLGWYTQGPDGYYLNLFGTEFVSQGHPVQQDTITGLGFTFSQTRDNTESDEVPFWESFAIPGVFASQSQGVAEYYAGGMTTDHTVFTVLGQTYDCTNGVCAAANTPTITAPKAAGDPTFTLEPLDFDHVGGVVLNITEGELGGTLCPCVKIPYPADALQNQVGVDALAKAIDSGQITAGDTVLGFSNGAVTAGAYLNGHTPTSGIRFVLLGMDTSKYGQLSVQGTAGLWGGTLQSAPAANPTTVVMRQYDGFAAYPSNIFAPGYVLAVQNATSNNQHDYANATILDNPNNITWTQDGITYELVPAASLPMNNWLRSIGLSSVADSLDSWQRPLIDQAYGALTPEMVLASARAKTAATAAEQVSGIQPTQKSEPVLGGGVDTPIGTSPSTPLSTMQTAISSDTNRSTTDTTNTARSAVTVPGASTVANGATPTTAAFAADTPTTNTAQRGAVRGAETQSTGKPATPNGFGSVTSQRAVNDGDIGTHVSSQPTPHLGVGNVARNDQPMFDAASSATGTTVLNTGTRPGDHAAAIGALSGYNPKTRPGTKETATGSSSTSSSSPSSGTHATKHAK